jgi:molybdopterin-guanine dinucleotide biosynthesis protein A
VVPVSAEGHYEPLFAVYRKSALPAMLRALEEGKRRVAAAFPYCNVRTAPVPPRVRLSNINTLCDYHRLLRSLESNPQDRMPRSPG